MRLKHYGAMLLNVLKLVRGIRTAEFGIIYRGSVRAANPMPVRTGFYCTRCEASGVSPFESDYSIKSLADRGESIC